MSRWALAAFLVACRTQPAPVEDKSRPAPVPEAEASAPAPIVAAPSATESAGGQGRLGGAVNDPTKVSVTVTIAEKNAMHERNLVILTHGLRNCAQRTYHAGTFAPGSADLAIVVQPNGDIERVTSTGTLSPDERDCMERRARSAIFDATGAARSVHVHVVHDPIQR